MKLLTHLLTFFLLNGTAFAGHYEVKTEWEAHKGGVQNIRFSPDGSLLATCGQADNSVKIWQINSGKILHALQLHTEMVHEVTFSPDGRWLASAGKDGQVIVWEVATGKAFRKYLNEPVYGVGKRAYKSISFVCFSSDNSTIYFGGENGFLYQASLSSEKAERIAQTNTHDTGYIKTITGGTLAPDGKSVMVAIDNFVKVVCPQSGEIIKTFYYPFDYINDVISGPKGRQISTWSYDGKVTIWDYQSGKSLNSIQVTAAKNYSTPNFSSNNQLLVTGAFGNSARVWDWQSSQPIAQLGGHHNIVRTAKFSPVEPIIATASYDGKIKIWEEIEIVKQEIAKKIEAPKKPADPKSFVKPSKEPTIYFLGKAIEVGNIIELDEVQFQKSSFDLTEAGKTQLLQVVGLLEEYPNISIEIHGHTDNVGHAIINYQLSEKRAQISKNFLIENGISPERVLIKAFGESKPSYTNSLEETRSLNRRIEIKVLTGITK